MMKKLLTVLFLIAVTGFFVTCNSSRAEQSSGAEDVSSDLINAIMASYSEKSFKEGVVPDDMIETILNCAQKAPSAANAQPWHFTVITNNEIARQIAPRHYVEGAAVIVISGKPSERAGFNIAFDAGLASQNIYLAAQALGFGVHQYLTGVQNINDNQKSTLGIPSDYIAQIIMLIGYSADDVDAVTAASARKPVDENVNYIK